MKEAYKIMKIAIIDSGISSAYLEKHNFNVKKYKTYKNNGKYYISEGPCEDEIGHGTAVSSIIMERNPNEEYFLFKVCEVDDNSIDMLLTALEYIYENLEVNLVHISSGCVWCENDKLIKLKALCDNLYNRGAVIVSAFDNNGMISYPAAFDSVVGVDWNSNIGINTEYIYYENSMINVGGVGSKILLPSINDKKRVVSGASFAAGYISNHILKFIKNGTKNIDILDELKNKAIKIEKASLNEKKDDKFEIKKAIILPYNKEIETLLSKKSLIDFEIIGIYDSKYSRNIGRKINDDLIIDEISQIDWNSNFDTVIIGHLQKKSFVEKNDYMKNILDKCLKYSKNIYMFDSLNDYQKDILKIKSKGGKVFCPNLKKENISQSTLGKMYGVCTPILAVVGTSSKQGKYTLQLSLKEIFVKNKYNVEMVSTEPTGCLVGAKTIPLGYGSNSDLSSKDIIVTANKMIHELEIEKKPDVIIVGTQSNTINNNTGNIRFYPLVSADFLYGTQPDGCVVCVNVVDDLEYINKTITFLEQIIECQVICLALFPLMEGKILEMDFLKKVANKFQSVIGKNVYIMGDENVKIYEKIIKFFTEP